VRQSVSREQAARQFVDPEPVRLPQVVASPQVVAGTEGSHVVVVQ
jgi:hypothetical protein